MVLELLMRVLAVHRRRADLLVTLSASAWQSRLDALAEEYGIVGASLAVSQADTSIDVATGTLNLRTNAPATPNAIFQAGSITKVWTATLLMQLVDDGLLDLDVPVVTYLPRFRVQDQTLTAAVTARQLLTHTSGIDGDLFLDTGRGDDALERYVSAMATLRTTVPPGEVMSYCNSGYSLLGHLVATLRENTFENVLRERLLDPLSLTSAGMFPEEALLHPAAVGHLHSAATGGPVVATRWAIYRSAGPAGLLHCTARDLITFAHMHLAGGVTSDGRRLLSDRAATAMRQPHISCPDPWQLGSHWGLGWILNTWGSQPVFGHDGGTLGQSAYLRVLPGVGLTIALMHNGGRSGSAFAHAVLSEVGQTLGQVGPPPYPTAVPGLRPVTERYTGSYSREGFELVVSGEALDQHLSAAVRMTSPLMADQPPITAPLRLHDENVLLAELPDSELPVPMVFFDHDGHRYVHLRGRATRRR